MKISLIFFIVTLAHIATGTSAENNNPPQLTGIWIYQSSQKHYSRQMEKDYFFGDKDELRFFSDKGLNESLGVVLRSESRKSSIGDIYLIWVECDQRGLVLKFGSNHDPIIFVGSVKGDQLRFEFVSHGETRIEYCFERISKAPGARPQNSK